MESGCTSVAVVAVALVAAATTLSAVTLAAASLARTPHPSALLVITLYDGFELAGRKILGFVHHASCGQLSRKRTHVIAGPALQLGEGIESLRGARSFFHGDDVTDVEVFDYIGASDLVPEVNKHGSFAANAVSFACFIAGLALLWLTRLVLTP